MTDADYNTVNNTLRDIARLKGELQTAKAAGAPCDDQLAGCEHYENAYTKWKAAYWPDRP